MNELNDADLKEAYEWIYNHWNTFSWLLSLFTMFGTIIGYAIAYLNVFIGVGFASVWALISGLSAGMLWVECGKPSKKKK